MRLNREWIEKRVETRRSHSTRFHLQFKRPIFPSHCAWANLWSWHPYRTWAKCACVALCIYMLTEVVFIRCEQKRTNIRTYILQSLILSDCLSPHAYLFYSLHRHPLPFVLFLLLAKYYVTLHRSFSVCCVYNCIRSACYLLVTWAFDRRIDLAFDEPKK